MSESTTMQMFDALSDAVTGRMMSVEMADAISARLIESSPSGVKPSGDDDPEMKDYYDFSKGRRGPVVVDRPDKMIAKPAPPIKRYRCLLCGRDKFTAKEPHNCTGGFRKHGIEWEEVNPAPPSPSGMFAKGDAPGEEERKEMLEVIDNKISVLVSHYGWLRLGDLKRNEQGNPINREYETLNKIRALILQPNVTVSRKDVLSWASEALSDIARNHSDVAFGSEDTRPIRAAMTGLLRDIGVNVKDEEKDNGSK